MVPKYETTSRTLSSARKIFCFTWNQRNPLISVLHLQLGKSEQFTGELTRDKLFVINGEISGRKIAWVDFSVWKKKRKRRICYTRIGWKSYIPNKNEQTLFRHSVFCMRHETQRLSLRQANTVTQNVKVWKCCSKNLQTYCYVQMSSAR